MRKLVKPADPAATIPDPVRKTALPPEGRVVDWSVHWARFAAREDIIVSDVSDDAKAGETKADDVKSVVQKPAAETAPESSGDIDKTFASRPSGGRSTSQ